MDCSIDEVVDERDVIENFGEYIETCVASRTFVYSRFESKRPGHNVQESEQ